MIEEPHVIWTTPMNHPHHDPKARWPMSTRDLPYLQPALQHLDYDQVDGVGGLIVQFIIIDYDA